MNIYISVIGSTVPMESNNILSLQYFPELYFSSRSQQVKSLKLNTQVEKPQETPTRVFTSFWPTIRISLDEADLGKQKV